MIAVGAAWEEEIGTRAAHRGDVTRAIRTTERLAWIGRENPNYHLGVAIAVDRRNGSPDLVRSHLERSLAIQPTAKGWAMLSQHLTNQGEREGAVTALRNALALEPERSETLLRYAEQFKRIGLYDDARRALERAVAISRGDPAPREALRQFLDTGLAGNAGSPPRGATP